MPLRKSALFFHGFHRPRTDIADLARYFRKVPEAESWQRRIRYSITSSARASLSGICRPSVVAVRRFMTRSLLQIQIGLICLGQGLCGECSDFARKYV